MGLRRVVLSRRPSQDAWVFSTSTVFLCLFPPARIHTIAALLFPMAYLHSVLSPFPKSSALSKHQPPVQTDNDSNKPIDFIPGELGIGLTQDDVYSFLSSELTTPLLDELYDNLWLVARKSGKNIDPLNRQRVKTREIIATEDARLHLVWYRNRIYVKPMPLCLLNHDFWATYLSSPVENAPSAHHTSAPQPNPYKPFFDRRIALGFMRSYALLVRHRVDFVLARESHLFPIEFDWEQWSEFIAHFRHIEDDEVANRYHYGQLRLSRLNWAVRLCRPSSAATKWFYEVPHWSIGMYVERAITPLLFGFASLSLVLSSMQVLLAVPDESLSSVRVDVSSLAAMRGAFWVFSCMVLLLSGVIWVLLFVIPFCGLIRELTWGFMNRGKINTEGLTRREQEALPKA